MGRLNPYDRVMRKASKMLEERRKKEKARALDAKRGIVVSPVKPTSKWNLPVDDHDPIFTPDRQWKMLLTIDGSLETLFSIAICRQSINKWQSKTLFLKIFDLRFSIVFTFSIAPYPV